MTTLAEVAARAGVGIGTVSRVINRHPSVSARMRARVEAAMDEVGYVKPRRQRGPDGHNGRVGVLVPFFDEPSAYQRLRGIVARLQPHGLNIVLFNVASPGQGQDHIAHLVHDQLDALIVISIPLDDGEGRQLAAAPYPTVLLDTSSPHLPSVGIDDRLGGMLATNHLLDLGHRRIGFIGEPPQNLFGFVSSARRQQGYTAALRDAGVTLDPTLIRHGAHLRSAAKHMSIELLSLDEPPTAIVAASDVQCVGVMEAAEVLGRQIPGDVSVVGYDDIDLASLMGITTVRQPLERSGRRVADLVVQALGGSALSAFAEEMELELVVRTTTGPVAHHAAAAVTDRPWWRDAVVYQIYVRSFADADADGIGDLRGIADRVDYLADLGVDAIWLTPYYPSPQHDHGYDVADYLAVDPAYGTLGDIDALVAACHERGLRVLADIVPNHCSSAHRWFQDALAAAPGSAARRRFFFRDGRGEHGELPPNNWPAAFGGSVWTRVGAPPTQHGQWYLATFTPWQPDLDWSDPTVVADFDEILRFWLARGIDGFRVDAVTHVGKAPGLPDAPPLPPGVPETAAAGHNPYAIYWPSAHEVWRHWRRTADEFERDHPGRQVVLVAEAYTARRPDLLMDYVRGDEFHEAFSFDLMLAPWHAASMHRAIDDTVATLHANGAAVTWTLNNHDTQRSVTRYGRADASDPASWTGNNLVHSAAPVDVALGTRRARAAIVLVAGLPGSLFVYAGEELGLPEVLDLAPEARTDPIFLRTDGRELGRDGCRIPLPWSSDPATAYGFSAAGATPWLPQPDDWATWAVSTEEGDPTSMLTLYREVLRLRRTLEHHGDHFEWVAADRRLVAFRRGAVTVVLNPTDAPCRLPDGLAGAELVLSSDVGLAWAGEVPPDTAVWLR